ncbi:MAG: DUF4097 family beta strand repeat protein [Deltaproteobacteria bacterium]|nr:DUF4097 family beta strand repeat protein [Deltaproteobacteria bacterium]MDQ3301351.1 DUF4097 family beta strand repeat-containing protein [Myxococcota bacterium]
MSRGTSRALIIATVASSLLVALAPHADADAVAVPAKLVERARLEIQPAGHAFKQITIENPLGDVRVEGYDGTAIQIETRKQAPNEEALDRLRVSLVPNTDGTVRIKTTADGGRELRPLARGAVRIDLIVRAPRAARIEAVSSSGTLEVINMDGGGDLDSGSGRITVRNVAGQLSTHSVSGPTSLAQVFGSVDAQTLSSDLDLDSIGGQRLVATANHGKIEGRRLRSRDIELTTMDGKIVIEAEASIRGKLVVSSMRGDIDVRLRRNGVLVVRGRGTKVNLGATSRSRSDGWVETQLGHLAAGVTPALVEMRSRHGNVQFAIIE